MPAITSRKPRLSPMPVCRARSPWPPTWLAAAPTSSWAAISKCGWNRKRAEQEAKLGRELTESELSLLTSQIKADIEVKKKRALDAGGLYVLGTERHESRRIDNQLRGRTGRQGDPGKSKFYISIEDDLMRIFAAERMDNVMRRLGIKEDEGITHPWMNKAMETSQKKIEQRNFEIRKNVLKYDDVINDQRKAIFEQRMEFMRAENVSDTILDMREDVVNNLVSRTHAGKGVCGAVGH